MWSVGRTSPSSGVRGMGGWGKKKKKREHIIAFSPARAATAPPPLLPLLIEKQSSDEFSPSYTVSPTSPMLYVHRDVGMDTPHALYSI